MQLTFTTEDDRIINLDVRLWCECCNDGIHTDAHRSPPATQVDSGESLDDLKAILEVDSGIPIAEQVLTNGGNIVTGYEQDGARQDGSRATPLHNTLPTQGNRGCCRPARW